MIELCMIVIIISILIAMYCKSFCCNDLSYVPEVVTPVGRMNLPSSSLTLELIWIIKLKYKSFIMNTLLIQLIKLIIQHFFQGKMWKILCSLIMALFFCKRIKNINKFQLPLIKQMYQKPKQTPYKTQQYKSLDHSKQGMIKKIQIVFVYYCGKGSKYNYTELQQKYFMEMATQLFILAGREDQFNRQTKKWVSVATLYYTKGRRKSLDQNQFLELLPGLAKEIFLDYSSPRKTLQFQLEQERAMKNLLILFQKLYLHINDEQLYRRGIKSEQIQEDTKQFLLKLRDSLTKLYKVYFEYETNLGIKQKDYQSKSFDCYLQIMKDFQVYPKLVSASQLYFIYNQVLNERQHNHLTLISPSLYTRTAYAKLGQMFTLSRFVQSLILVSHISVSKLKRVEGEELYYNQTNMTQKELLKLLLEYMETMRSIKQKYCKFSRQRFSLIVYEEYSEYVSKTKRQESLKSSPQKGGNHLNQSKRSFYDILNKIGI